MRGRTVPFVVPPSPRLLAGNGHGIHCIGNANTIIIHHKQRQMRDALPKLGLHVRYVLSIASGLVAPSSSSTS
jgi:hypothetical protein